MLAPFRLHIYMELLTFPKAHATSADRLAQALTNAGAPPRLIVNARIGAYDPIRSPFTFPKIALLHDLRVAKLHALAMRVIAGEFEGA